MDVLDVAPIVESANVLRWLQSCHLQGWCDPVLPTLQIIVCFHSQEGTLFAVRLAFFSEDGETINTTIAAVQPPASTETHSTPGARVRLSDALSSQTKWLCDACGDTVGIYRIDMSSRTKKGKTYSNLCIYIICKYANRKPQHSSIAFHHFPHGIVMWIYPLYLMPCGSIGLPVLLRSIRCIYVHLGTTCN